MHGVTRLDRKTEEDWNWADEREPLIENAVRSVGGKIINIKVAERSKDLEKATDYIIQIKSGEIACRVRRPKDRHGNNIYETYGDVTFRCSRPSGVKTEIQKLIEGFARWYLYAWTKDKENPEQFKKWIFFDLDVLRQRDLLKKWRKEKPRKWNKDDSSEFLYNIMPNEIRNVGAIVGEDGGTPTLEDFVEDIK